MRSCYGLNWQKREAGSGFHSTDHQRMADVNLVSNNYSDFFSRIFCAHVRSLRVQRNHRKNPLDSPAKSCPCPSSLNGLRTFTDAAVKLKSGRGSLGLLKPLF